MSPRLRLAGASRSLQPLQQGNLDGLCGLYAVINAVRVVHHPDRLSRKDLAQLFATGIEELHRARRLQAALTIGIDEKPWMRMARTIVTKAEVLTSKRLKLERLSVDRHHPLPLVIDAIKAVNRQGCPIVISLAGVVDHWSVIVRFSPSRFTLFDSAGHRWINLSAIGVEAGARYHLSLEGITALRAV